MAAFPIMRSMDSKVSASQTALGIPRSIPWELILPHERQADRNHGQTLKRLAERGGLSPCEAVAVIEDRDWRPMSDDEAIARLLELMRR